MAVSPDDSGAPAEALSTRTFGPPATVVLGTLVAGVIFVVVLEFLVIISFVGQRLWSSPLLGHDPLFTLPFALWVAVLIASIAIMLRVLTAWLQIDERGFVLRGLCRRTVTAGWDEVGRVIAVRDVGREDGGEDSTTSAETAYDGVYVLDREDHRLLAVSSRFFGPRAQDMALRRAREAGVRIDHVDAVSTSELKVHAPQALTFADQHPNLILLALAAFYVGHNALTFAIWGL